MESSIRTTEFLVNLLRAVMWVHDLEQGDFIDAPGYDRIHLKFRGVITQDDVNAINLIVNQALKHSGSTLRVFNRWGELIPGEWRVEE